jgi:hypothetical protein
VPYEHIENIRDSGDEKIALLLSLNNMIGILALGLPTYLVTATLDGLLRIALLLAAGTLGFLLTLDAGGMTVASRVLWHLRGRARLALQGDRIDPSALPITVRPSTRLRVLALASPVRPLGYGRARMTAPSENLAPQPGVPLTIAIDEAPYADHAAR